MYAGGWSLDSWRTKPIKQQPKYPNEADLNKAVEQVRRLPPLVTHEEVDRLRAQLAEVAEGKRFLLQGGDCAERFLDCAAEPIEQKLRILLQMSLVLTWGARIPTLRIARMAGQFAKPRSKDTELVDGVEYTAFRGDNVNSFDLSAREADPARLVTAYFHSAATLNWARALLSGGLADLQHATHWDLGFVQDAGHRRQYRDMADRILSSLDFMRVCGLGNESALKTADVFMSHEGLQLAYEEALTRPVPPPAVLVGTTGAALPRKVPSGTALAPSAPSTPVAPPAAHHFQRSESTGSTTEAAVGAAAPPTAGPRGSAVSSATPMRNGAAAAQAPVMRDSYYNLGTHFLWIGDRTRQLDHAHVEYCRGIANPVGIKVGPTTDPAELVSLLRVLWPNPRKQRGKIVLITRFGARSVRAKLPALIAAIAAAAFEAPVVWVCDPMHGNTRVTASGIKTRSFDDVLEELRHTFEVHREMGSRLGGAHFELTGENVTECTGGPERLLEGDLPRRYTTYCDPRLNYAQSMELAFLMAQYLADIREEELEGETGVPSSAFIGGGGGGFGASDADSFAAPLPAHRVSGGAAALPQPPPPPEMSDTDTDGGGSVGSLDQSLAARMNGRNAGAGGGGPRRRARLGAHRDVSPPPPPAPPVAATQQDSGAAAAAPSGGVASAAHAGTAPSHAAQGEAGSSGGARSSAGPGGGVPATAAVSGGPGASLAPPAATAVDELSPLQHIERCGS